MNNAKLITFEGIDGAGKSTHIPFVVSLLEAAGKNVVSTREPGGTELGEQLRVLLLRQSMHIETEALLMFAARREHIDKVIAPALARGNWVVSDRFTDASFAYQGGGRKLAIEKLEILEKWVHPDLQPDLTLLFDVPLEVARARLSATRELDKFEQEQTQFFSNTRLEYLRRAAEYPARFRVINSNRPIKEIQEELSKIVKTLY
jgi:dTMP kinase